MSNVFTSRQPNAKYQTKPESPLPWKRLLEMLFHYATKARFPPGSAALEAQPKRVRRVPGESTSFWDGGRLDFCIFGRVLVEVWLKKP